MGLHIVVTKAVGSKAPGALQGMAQGFNQQVDKLGELLEQLVSADGGISIARG